MLTDNELQILRILRKNGREKLTGIANESEMPLATVFTTLKKIKKRIISRFTPLLRLYEMGYGIRMIMILPNRPRTLDKLLECPNVNNLCITKKGIFVETVYKSANEKAEALKGMPKAREYFVIEELKNQDFSIEKDSGSPEKMRKMIRRYRKIRNSRKNFKNNRNNAVS